MCVLMLQIVETRILSVISFYHLAFFAISMAMFGMTAGSLVVYFNPTFFAPERLFANVVWITAAFAVVVVLSTMMLISTVVIDPATGFLLAVLLWGKVIAALVPPYVFAGMAISLALTRSPWPVGLVYGADLAGAAFGCLGALVLMSTLDGVSAMLMVGAIGAIASCAFALAGRDYARSTLPLWLVCCNIPDCSPSCSPLLRSATRHFNPTVCASQWPRARSRTSAISSTSGGIPIRASSLKRLREIIR